MSQLPTYSFLPWMRQGIANSIMSGDGDTSVLVRPRIPVRLTIHGQKLDGAADDRFIDKTVQLYGPGDIIGIDRRAIFKVAPLNWITNFETNYLPYIEFYDEDFPWRYTPAAPNQERLRPWLTLVVLKEDEFDEGANLQGRPLPFFKLKAGKTAASLFPASNELWAWAHVHANQDLGSGTDSSGPTVVNNLTSLLKTNADMAYSRIISPRKLEPTTGYHAFLIPTFEAGRLAGNGQPVPSTLVATTTAWDANQTEFPFYFRWYFKTGTVGDFEYLVTILKPKRVNPRVGNRDIDVQHPGSNLPPISQPTALNGLLWLGGALRVPQKTLSADPVEKAKADAFEGWDESPYPHPFETAAANLINLANDYQKDGTAPTSPTADPDPIITLPLYGRWHALVDRLLTEADGDPDPHPRNWVHELNLDPRFRVGAGLGTKVIQKNQEDYMQAAWEQVGDLPEANNTIRKGQVSKETATRLYNRFLSAELLTTAQQPMQRLLWLTAPIHKRVVSEGLTIHAHVRESTVPTPVTSAAFRQLVRPRGRLIRQLPFDDTRRPDNLVERINQEDVKAAPDKTVPTGAVDLNDLASQLQPTDVSPTLIDWLRRVPRLKFWLLVVAIILILLLFLLLPVVGALIVGSAIGAVTYWLYQRIGVAEQKLAIPVSVQEFNQRPEVVDTFPARPDFRISTPGENFVPGVGSTDSAEASRFKRALKSAYQFLDITFPTPVRKRLDLTTLVRNTVASIHPDKTIPNRVLSGLSIPGRFLEEMTEPFTPVMNHPIIDLPMYRPLKGLSDELFLPNIKLIEQNSITLLETNQRFIESYMVGLNHEMSRELLWREFPTDNRGSYFRQFWEVDTLYENSPPTLEERETYRDIPPLHKWTPSSALGAHNQREPAGDDAQLVLVIRGELLKKYPTAVIYAQRAEWVRNADGTINRQAERTLTPISDAEEDKPPRDKLQLPLFEAKVDPDIYFFGFDLTDTEVKGDKGMNPTDKAGWFFVIKERPGEPQFGLDIAESPQLPRLINWNNLTWQHLETHDGDPVRLNKSFTFTPYVAAVDQENKPNPQDSQARWGSNSNAAELAYILYQVPVMVAVHGSRMLP